MPIIDVNSADIRPIKETFTATALEDLQAGDIVVMQASVDGEQLQVSKWRDVLGMQFSGMALADAAKGDTVECAYRISLILKAKLDGDYWLVE